MFYFQRRDNIRAYLTLVYEILLGVVDTQELFTIINIKYDVRGGMDPSQLLQEHCRVNVRKHLCIERVIMTWHSLPAEQNGFYYNEIIIHKLSG